MNVKEVVNRGWGHKGLRIPLVSPFKNDFLILWEKCMLLLDAIVARPLNWLSPPSPNTKISALFFSFLSIQINRYSIDLVISLVHFVVDKPKLTS